MRFTHCETFHTTFLEHTYSGYTVLPALKARQATQKIICTNKKDEDLFLTKLDSKLEQTR